MPNLRNKVFRGLLCDLDGTLVDSEPLHCTAWLELLSEQYELDYDEQWFEQWIGTSEQVVADYLVKEHDWQTDPQKIILQKQGRFHAAVPEQAKLFPGVAEALTEIAAAFPLAIATNSGRADADIMIAATALDRFTTVSVSASEVEHIKPAPDIYLRAAERLGLVASDCIAIEDSGPGGAAAKAAGCYLIGLNERVTRADEYAQDNATALHRALELLSASRAVLH